jgi:hypothetical protein
MAAMTKAKVRASRSGMSNIPRAGYSRAPDRGIELAKRRAGKRRGIRTDGRADEAVSIARAGADFAHDPGKAIESSHTNQPDGDGQIPGDSGHLSRPSG